MQAGCVPSPASPHLPSALITAARSLLALATSALARADCLASTLITTSSSSSSSLGAGLQQVVREVGSLAVSGARAKLRAVSEVLLEEQEAWPGVEAAEALGAVAAALQQALAVEAVTALMVLQEKQVRQDTIG